MKVAPSGPVGRTTIAVVRFCRGASEDLVKASLGRLVTHSFTRGLLPKKTWVLGSLVTPRLPSPTVVFQTVGMP